MIIASNIYYDQFTVYNYPYLGPKTLLTDAHLKSLREFEKLHEVFLSSPNKKDVLLKKVYQLETYCLYAIGDYVIMATINHNRTSKTIQEVCSHVVEDIKMDEESCFIVTHF
mmetsp:Transcript_18895/g.13709  ORF Transcript_18895/g.13709 Transcript_18895/m.13709 type:complete len:112 (+) Transcript_18895:360-695(+)